MGGEEGRVIQPFTGGHHGFTNGHNEFRRGYRGMISSIAVMHRDIAESQEAI